LLTVSSTLFDAQRVLILSQVIVLQMFIAVINENFDVAEELKKDKQASTYWATHRPQETKVAWLHRLNPYHWVEANPVKVKVDLPADLMLPIQQSLIEDQDISRLAGPSAPVSFNTIIAIANAHLALTCRLHLLVVVDRTTTLPNPSQLCKTFLVRTSDQTMFLWRTCDMVERMP
jgi:hypothetical protein